METTEAEHKNEKQQVSDNESTEKKSQPSKRQLDHLKYAREMKRLKKEQKEHEVATQNKNLDFIYKRLTNIEKDMQTLVEARYVPATGKRSRKNLADSEDEETKKPKKSPKFTKTSSEDSAKPSSFFYDTFIPYAGRALLVGGGTIALSFIKNYAAGLYTTTDREPVGGYYFA